MRLIEEYQPIFNIFLIFCFCVNHGPIRFFAGYGVSNCSHDPCKNSKSIRVTELFLFSFLYSFNECARGMPDALFAKCCTSQNVGSCFHYCVLIVLTSTPEGRCLCQPPEKGVV